MHRRIGPFSCGAVVAACATAVLTVTALPAAAAAATATTPASPRPARAVVAPAVVPALRGAVRLGSMPASTGLDLRVVLAPRDPAGLARFVAAVSTPGSPDYRRYLAPGEFSRRFGPTPSTVASVRAWLRTSGLVPGSASPDGMIIPVRTDAAAAQRALHTGFARVRLSDGRTAFANTTAATISAPLSRSVRAVVGLDDVSRPHPQLVRAHTVPGSAAPSPRATTTTTTSSSPHAAGPVPCATASGTASTFGAYTADQLATAYGFTSLYGRAPAVPGAGQTVAVYELEPFTPSDISTYQACYGTATPVSVVPVDGGAGAGSGSGEAALDIEDVIGLSPGVSIKVYEAPNGAAQALDNYQRIVDDDVAQVISTSWGICEAQAGGPVIAAEAALFQQAAAQGQTVLAASGDDGSEDCVNSSGVSTGVLAVDDPGSQPYVTSVGGTDLSALGPPPTETVWNDPRFGASGGGVSSYWAMPSWQSASGVTGLPSSASSGLPCGNTGGFCREVPDVAASADPIHGYVVYFSGQWGVDGGASAGPPLWAALLSVVNQGIGGRAGFVNPVLYQKSGAQILQLNDIISGNNDLTGTTSGNYPATTGYDMATGLGTPVGCSLAGAFGVPGVSCPGAAVSSTLSTLTAAPTSVSADGVTPATVTVDLVDPSGNPVSGKTATLTQGAGHSTVSPAAGGVTDRAGRVQFTVTDATPETVTYTAIDTTDRVVLSTTGTVGFGNTAQVAPGGTVSSAPAGTSPDATNPVVVSLTSPNAGAVSFTPAPVTETVPGVHFAGFGMNISAPQATPSQPLSITFQVAAAAFPPGTAPGDVGVVQDGALVEPCTGASVPTQAVPDPCQAAQSLGGGVLSLTVLSSHASTWGFASPLAVRLAGADREATAVAVSQASFADRGAGAVVLARDDTYPDALAGAALAAARNAPVLLTSPTALDTAPAAELQRVLPSGQTVYLLGGPSALSGQVASRVAALGYQVVRLSGADRYATAAAIAGAVGAPTAVLLTTGDDFPDALAAAAASGGGSRVVLLTHGSQMPAATASYLSAHPGLARFAVGGPAAAADPSATAVVGADRYATAVAVARQFFTSPGTVGLATGLSFPDALAAGPRLARLGVPLLLSDPEELSSATGSYLTSSAHTITRLEAYGGAAALSDVVLGEAEVLTAG